MAAIGIDGIQIAPDARGVGRVQRRLAESLAALRRHELVVFVREPGEALLPAVRTERISEPFFLAWQQWGMPRAARRLRLDAVLTLTDRTPVWGGGRYVVWLFELPTHRIEQNRRIGAGLWQRVSDLVTSALWKRSLRTAAAVAAGSRATADEIEREVPELRGRVHVVYPGLDERFVPGAPARDRYVFHLGSSDPRDNLVAVVEAFRRAQARVAEPVRLVLGGRVPSDVGGDGVELTGFLGDDELVRCYQGAAAYLDATLYEGFGLQPLEAMACGVPVVASRASSLPEVVADAGILCDPHSPAELADALVRVLDEPALATSLRERGIARAADFTWERTARAFADVLDAVAA